MKKLAELARITISEKEIESLKADIATILEYVKEVEKAGVSHGKPHVGDIYNVTRPDADPHESGAFTEALLALASQREGDYIKVKRILA